MRVAAIVLLGAVLAGCSGPTDSNYHPNAGPGPSTAARPPTDRQSPTDTPTSPNVPGGSPTPPRPVVRATSPTRPTAPAIARVTAAELGASWHAGCPIEPSELRMVTVTFHGFDGRAHSGRLVVAADLAEQIRTIFTAIYAAGFPIRRMVPVAAYGGSDERSMEADNSSAFNCRPITGGSGWSEHAYGTAIDLNPRENPYVSASGVQPTTAQRFTDRDRTDPGMIHPDDRTVTIFARYGWSWGGAWTEPRDYQHFEK
jgi:hypothetical protein